MKQQIKNIVAAGLLAVGTCGATAQNTYSGYFLDNYLYRSEMNPAFGNETNYVGFPALGNVNVGMQGNLHLTSVLYNVNGKTSLFTNPNVSVEEVMKGIHDKNRLGAEIKLNVLNAGFKAFGGYNTVAINVRGDVNAQLPGSLFSLLKEGVSNKTYDIKNLRANAVAYGEIVLNHSRDIKQVPGLRVGGAVKFLLGYGQLDARMEEAQLVLGEDSWNIRSNALIRASVKGLKYKTDYNDDAHREYVSGMEIDGTGLNGFGLGFDLGAEYKWQDFRFSAALLDLGFISWSNTSVASTNGLREVQTSKYEFDVNGTDDSDEWDRLKNDLTALYQMDDLGNTGGRTTALAATLNFGVEYNFPLYRPLSFGLVNSTRIQGAYTWTQFRLSANVRPVKCLSASANLAMGTYGVGFGWLVNVNTGKGFSFFCGMDHTMGKLAKQGVPLNSNAKFNIGIDFPF
ncbi:MAG: hypothetical protein K2L96_03340 [Muribaculaceae bacterium]|nr:hypothetical protein [Muribaculaceae bacterium]